MRTTHRIYVGSIAAALAITSIAVVSPVLAQVPQSSRVPGPYGQFDSDNGQHSVSAQWRGHTATATTTGNMPMMRPGIIGTVMAVNGTTLSVASTNFGSATTTYSVDASRATVYKNNAASTLSNVAVGDHIFVEGTVSGTNVTATIIRDDIGGKGTFNGRMRRPGMGSTTYAVPPGFNGNGQPVVAGTVSAIHDSSIIITTTSGTSYAVDISSSTISKSGATSTPTSITIGDYLVVQGSVNGNSVTASSVLDQGPTSGTTGAGGQSHGFFASIGQFFRKLFGF